RSRSLLSAYPPLFRSVGAVRGTGPAASLLSPLINPAAIVAEADRKSRRVTELMSESPRGLTHRIQCFVTRRDFLSASATIAAGRSEEHTSELQQPDQL